MLLVYSSAAGLLVQACLRVELRALLGPRCVACCHSPASHSGGPCLEEGDQMGHPTCGLELAFTGPELEQHDRKPRRERPLALAPAVEGPKPGLGRPAPGNLTVSVGPHRRSRGPVLHRHVWEQVCACVCVHTCVHLHACLSSCPSGGLFPFVWGSRLRGEDARHRLGGARGALVAFLVHLPPCCPGAQPVRDGGCGVCTATLTPMPAPVSALTASR